MFIAPLRGIGEPWDKWQERVADARKFYNQQQARRAKEAEARREDFEDRKKIDQSAWTERERNAQENITKRTRTRQKGATDRTNRVFSDANVKARTESAKSFGRAAQEVGKQSGAIAGAVASVYGAGALGALGDGGLEDVLGGLGGGGGGAKVPDLGTVGKLQQAAPYILGAVALAAVAYLATKKGK